MHMYGYVYVSDKEKHVRVMLEYTNQVTAVATVEEYIISLILLCREVGSIVAWIKDKVSPLSLNMDFSKNKWYISWTAVKKMCSFSMHATFKFYPCILISWLTDLVGKWIVLFRQKRADRNEKKWLKGFVKWTVTLRTVYTILQK